MMRSEGCMPAVILSRSTNPVSRPVTGALRLDSSSICLKTSLTIGRDRRKSGTELLVGDIEYRFFDVLQNFLRRFLILVAAGHGFVGDLDQPAQSRFLFDDLGVVLDVDGTRQAVGEAGQVGGASDAFEFVGALEFFLERDQVDRPGIVHQLEHLLEDAPMTVEVEVLRFQALKNREDGFVVEKDRSQNRAFRFQVVREAFFPG